MHQMYYGKGFSVNACFRLHPKPVWALHGVLCPHARTRQLRSALIQSFQAQFIVIMGYSTIMNAIQGHPGRLNARGPATLLSLCISPRVRDRDSTPSLLKSTGPEGGGD